MTKRHGSIVNATCRPSLLHSTALAVATGESRMSQMLTVPWLLEHGFRQDNTNRYSNRYIIVEVFRLQEFRVSIEGGGGVQAYLGDIVKSCEQMLQLMAGLGIKDRA